MMTEWSSETVFKFLKVYEAEPIIWNPKHPCHRDKTAVNDAWIRVANTLDLPVAEVKKKKESLMTTFRFHLKKKKASIKSDDGLGAVYNPTWFAFQYMEQFLGQVYECGSIYNGQEIEPHKQRQSFGEEDHTSITPRRRSMHPPQLLEAYNQLKQAFNTLNNVLSQKQNKEEDECDLYGRLLAKRLKKMTDNEREEIMYEIDTLIMEKRSRRSIID